MTTQNEILTEVCKLCAAGPISDLSGGIYKKTRPTDSKLEDCVLSIISGSNAKFLQDGALYVKIFYADIYSNNTYSEDALNGDLKEKLLFDLSIELLGLNSGYSFQVQTREIYVEKVLDDDIHEHFAILKINFKKLQ